MSSLPLCERLENWNDQVTVDSENRLVLNVALAGQSSRNGYRYTDEALRLAVGLYENRPVFLDHAANRQRPQERSTRDLVGSITNPQFTAGRIRGDIRVLDTESGQTFLKLVESQAAGVGMSHVVLAERSADGKEVLRISEVLSVDVVINPATTVTFAESLQDSGASEEADALLWNAERARLLAEIEQLKEELQLHLVQNQVRQLIASAQLPAEAVSECFHRQLLTAGTAELREQLVHDRAALFASRSAPVARVASQSRMTGSGARRVDDEFISTLKRRRVTS